MNKWEYIKLSLQVVGISLGIVFLYLLYRKVDPIAIARVGVYISVCLAVVRIISGRKCINILIYLIFLLFLSIIMVAIEIKSFYYVMQFMVLLTLALWAPYLLFILAYRLPIKTIYRKAVVSAFLSIVPQLVFGRWGNAIQTLATILIVIPLYYSIIKESDSKERWFCLAIFVVVFTLFLFLFGSIEYIAFPMIAYILFLLLTRYLSVSPFQERKKWLLLVLLMIVACPVSFFGSLNSYYFLVKENDGGDVDLNFPLSYMLVVNDCDTLNEKTMQGKNVVVFFWSSHCANCHKEFPSFSKLAGEFEYDTTKVFIAAFVPFGEDGEEAYYQKEIEHDFAFEWAEVVYSRQIMKDLGFNSFPHLTVLDNNGLVVYNGLYVNKKGVFVNNVRTYLKKL
ncbi:MAG: redoxin domain-containing protein [Bacteroidales bacterium]|nr:redoxin domain-containing protein [Bacteroidales bacterium]